jgi:putative endonuclease
LFLSQLLLFGALRYRSHMHAGPYFTYIVASKSRTLYIGVTSDLVKRVFEHKQKKHAGFSARYNCNRLVWFQRFGEVSEAIQREKELKGWLRAKKTALIQANNPTWEDLSAPWYPHLNA